MLKAISRVLFWRYSRGSWQYDILCALILCFIFLTPRAVFDGSAFKRAQARQAGPQEAQPDGATAGAVSGEGDARAAGTDVEPAPR